MDPPVSFEAGQLSGQSSQTEGDIGMKPVHYNAAAKGDIEHFREIRNPDTNLELLTPNRNTVLHIYLSSLKVSESNDSELSTAFVEEILEMWPLLLRQANVKGETPLHIAARYGHAAIADVLIERARERAPQVDLENRVNAVQEMLEMTNNEKDTALHEAVRGNHLNVVERLIQGGIDFSYSQNEAGETPLYMAVERGFIEVMDYILDNCTSPAHDGPLGRTALHAAVIRGNSEMVQKILSRVAVQERSAFIKQVDKQCWTPLHCAAYFGTDSITGVLLKVDRSIAYMKDAKGLTALHIAAHRGYPSVMFGILSHCPDCSELVDERGWNALHFVVNSSSSIWTKKMYILKGLSLGKLSNEKDLSNLLNEKDAFEGSLLSNLLNEKDARGNTPLHHHSKSLHYIKDVMCHSRVDKMAFNKNNLSAYDVALTSEELFDKKCCIIKFTNTTVVYRVAATLIILPLTAAVKPHPFKMCAFLCLAGYSLSQILIISVLHVAQLMQVTRAFISNGLRPEFRRPLEDDIVSKRKYYVDEWGRFKAWISCKDRFVSSMKEASQYHLVVDTLIATVAFTAGITMPGGFRDHDGPHPGSAVLTGNAAFKVFVIANTMAMVQSCSAAFIHLFMPLLFHDKNHIGDFSFLLASLAFCLSISAMGAMMLAFVMGTYAVLMHSLGLAIANSVIGLLFFIPLFLVSIGCSQYFREMWKLGLSRLFDFDFNYVLLFLLGICITPPFICGFLYGFCWGLLEQFLLCVRWFRRGRNDADHSTAS